VICFLFGAISALAGRWTDAVSMRFVYLVMTLPPVIFLLVLASIAGTGIWPTVLVISKHALRNALLPIVTLIGSTIGLAIGGAIFI
ncbi:ABC transporter permease subunit, partial [Rhizobium johnstonii]